MPFRPKEYFKPTSIEEAVSLLAKYGDKATPLAGGTDILVDKPSDVEYIIDITGLPLDYIEAEEYWNSRFNLDQCLHQ